jgi:hypothetical protein
MLGNSNSNKTNNNNTAGIAAKLSTKSIYELMNSVGLVVSAVVLKANGTAIEVAYDSTPKTNHAQKLLNGLSPTIIGEYEDLNVILVRGRISAPNNCDIPVNNHKLRFPFAHLNGTIRGDIFCYRLSANAQHQSFTLAEYQEFMAQPKPSSSSSSSKTVGTNTNTNTNTNTEMQALEQAVMQSKERSASISAEDNDDDDEEEDVNNNSNNSNNDSGSTTAAGTADASFPMDADFIRSVIVNKIKKDFPQKFGREATDNEVQDFYEATLQAFKVNFGGSGIGTDLVSATAPVPSNNSNGNTNGTLNLLSAINEDADDSDEDPDYDPTIDAEDEEAEELKDEEMEDDDNNDDPEFTKEFEDAIQSIQQLDVKDRQRILTETRAMYMAETGLEPTEKQLADAFALINVDNPSQAPLLLPLSESAIRAELQSVLMKSNRKPRLALANNIYKAFAEINGREPNRVELQLICDHVKAQLETETTVVGDDGNNADEEASAGNRDTTAVETRKSTTVKNRRQQSSSTTATTTTTKTEKVSYTQSVFADIASQSDALPTVVLRAAQKVLLEQLQRESIREFGEQRQPTAMELQESVVRLASKLFGNLTTRDLMAVNDELDRLSSASVSPMQDTMTVVVTMDEKECTDDEEVQEPVETETVVKHIKMLTTPIKSKGAGTRLDIYFEKPQSAKNLMGAKKQFVKMNHRQPTEAETSKLSEFFKIGEELNVTEMDVTYERVRKTLLDTSGGGGGGSEDDEKDIELNQRTATTVG